MWKRAGFNFLWGHLALSQEAGLKQTLRMTRGQSCVLLCSTGPCVPSAALVPPTWYHFPSHLFGLAQFSWWLQFLAQSYNIGDPPPPPPPLQGVALSPVGEQYSVNFSSNQLQLLSSLSGVRNPAFKEKRKKVIFIPYHWLVSHVQSNSFSNLIPQQVIPTWKAGCS